MAKALNSAFIVNSQNEAADAYDEDMENFVFKIQANVNSVDVLKIV